jgi:3-methyladenine DNA glycosylase Tag
MTTTTVTVRTDFQDIVKEVLEHYDLETLLRQTASAIEAYAKVYDDVEIVRDWRKVATAVFNAAHQAEELAL